MQTETKGRVALAVAVFITGTLVSGCRTFTKPAHAKSFHDDKVLWMDFDATRRGAVLISTNTAYKVVFEPTPDVAMGVVAEIVTKFSITNQISAENSVKITESLTSLGEVTTTVKALRESLFRISELAANNQINPEQTETLYKEALKTMIKLAEAQANKSDPKNLMTQLKTREAELEIKRTELKTAELKIEAEKHKGSNP